MFRGRHEHTIDPKGRVSIPAKFRDILGKKYDDRLVITNFDGCLVAYPYEEWIQLEEKASAQALTSGVAKTGLAAQVVAKKDALEQDRAKAQLEVAPAVQEVKTNELNGVLAKNASPRDANPSDLVSGEEMGNQGVLVPTRFFNLVMTIILVAIYAVNLGYLILTKWHTGIDSFPELGTASATLLTLTHAAYLADKVPDKEDVEP